MRSSLRPAPLIIAGALLLAPAPAAAALVDWLVLLVDASGSIDADEYRLQHEAYVRVLRDPHLASLLEGAQVAIVEFAEVPEVVVDWIDKPEQAAAAYAAHQRSVAWPGPASTTGIARALGLALDMLEGKSGRRVIDISGDGSDNVDWVAAVWSQRDRARELFIEINGLAIPTPEDPGDRPLLRRERHQRLSGGLPRAPRLRARPAHEDAYRDRRADSRAPPGVR